MSLSRLLQYGAINVYSQSHKMNYDMFIKSTEGFKDLVKDERAQVTSAYDDARDAEELAQYIPDHGFAEKSKKFDLTLHDAIVSCKSKGLNVKSPEEQFFYNVKKECDLNDK